MTLLPALPIILFKVSVYKIISQACCNQHKSTLSVSANMAVMAVAHVRELNSPRKKYTYTRDLTGVALVITFLMTLFTVQRNVISYWSRRFTKLNVSFE